MHRSNLIAAKGPRAVARPVAVLLALGLLLTGLSACGSSDSGDTKRSTAPVVKKEAGTLHVDLAVINRSAQSLPMTLCDGPVLSGSYLPAANCPFINGSTGALGSGQTASSQSGGGNAPSGYLVFPGGSRVYFYANNPAIGQPYIDLETNPLTNPGSDGNNKQSLVEGESRPLDFGGHALLVERQGDTDYKEMRLIVR